MASFFKQRASSIVLFSVSAFLGFLGLIFSVSQSELFLALRLSTQTVHLTGLIGSLAFLSISFERRFLHDRYLYLSLAVGLGVWNLAVCVLHGTGFIDPIWLKVPLPSLASVVLKLAFCAALYLRAYRLPESEKFRKRDFYLPIFLSSALIALATAFSFRIQTDEFAIVNNAQMNFQASFKQSVREVLEKEVIPLRLLLSIKNQSFESLYDASFSASRGVLAASDSLLALTLISKSFEPLWSAQKYGNQSFELQYHSVIKGNREDLDSGQMVFANNPELERRNQVEIVVPYFQQGAVRAYLIAVFDFEKVIQSVAHSFIDPSFGYRLWGNQGAMLIDERTRNPFPWLGRQSAFGFSKKGFILETFPHVNGALALTSMIPQVLMMISFALSLFISQLMFLYRKLVRSYDFVETQVRERTQELAMEKQRAEVANEAKTQFLANISHEVRTPLNVVMGVIELLRETKMDDSQKRFVMMLKQSSENMLYLVNDFLDLSKIEHGQIQLEARSFDPQSLISEIVSLYRIKAQEKGLSLTLNETNEYGGWYVGDSHRIRQILSNLLSNAIKFTEKGSVTVQVDYQIAGLQLTVADTGVGIPDEKRQIIFDRFTQVDASPSRRSAGTGLGLAIVKRLVDLMTGRIEIESVMDQGSVFKVVLPLEKSLVAATTQDQKQFHLANLDKDKVLRILIVDDSSENRELIKLFLKKENCELTEAENGEKAFELMRAQSFDLILMDLQMPVMDGYTALTKIRDLEQLEGQVRRPIVALTAHAMNEDREKCIKQGFDGYLAKPIGKEELIFEINKYRLKISTQIVEQNVFPAPS
jgi:signal transduction histidine kinase/ActR/RegA family two-component response regulator